MEKLSLLRTHIRIDFRCKLKWREIASVDVINGKNILSHRLEMMSHKYLKHRRRILRRKQEAFEEIKAIVTTSQRKRLD